MRYNGYLFLFFTFCYYELYRKTKMGWLKVDLKYKGSEKIIRILKINESVEVKWIKKALIGTSK